LPEIPGPPFDREDAQSSRAIRGRDESQAKSSKSHDNFSSAYAIPTQCSR
jgi:hypothetical protein